MHIHVYRDSISTYICFDLLLVIYIPRCISTETDDIAPGQVHAVRSEADLKNLQATGKLVVTDWYAQWCGPCKIFKPTFQKMAEEQTDVLFCKIDVDEFHDLVADHGIRSIPTFQASGRAIIRIAKSKWFFHAVKQHRNSRLSPFRL